MVWLLSELLICATPSVPSSDLACVASASPLAEIPAMVESIPTPLLTVPFDTVPPPLAVSSDTVSELVPPCDQYHQAPKPTKATIIMTTKRVFPFDMSRR